MVSLACISARPICLSFTRLIDKLYCAQTHTQFFFCASRQKFSLDSSALSILHRWRVLVVQCEARCLMPIKHISGSSKRSDRFNHVWATSSTEVSEFAFQIRRLLPVLYCECNLQSRSNRRLSEHFWSSLSLVFTTDRRALQSLSSLGTQSGILPSFNCFVGLVVKASASRAAESGSIPSFAVWIFLVMSYQRLKD